MWTTSILGIWYLGFLKYLLQLNKSHTFIGKPSSSPFVRVPSLPSLEFLLSHVYAFFDIVTGGIFSHWFLLNCGSDTSFFTLWLRSICCSMEKGCGFLFRHFWGVGWMDPLLGRMAVHGARLLCFNGGCITGLFGLFSFRFLSDPISVRQRCQNSFYSTNPTFKVVLVLFILFFIFNQPKDQTNFCTTATLKPCNKKQKPCNNFNLLFILVFFRSEIFTNIN